MNWAMMLSWISLVPPPISSAGSWKYCSISDAPSIPSSSRSPAGEDSSRVAANVRRSITFIATLATLDAARGPLHRGETTLPALCAEHGLSLALDELAYYAHWRTPVGIPKRFDTRFFAALAPAGQQALHDAGETVEHRWLRPADVLQARVDVLGVDQRDPQDQRPHPVMSEPRPERVEEPGADQGAHRGTRDRLG